MPRIHVLIVASVLVLLIGCGTMSEVLKSKDEGTVQVYSIDREQAWKIAIAALRWEGTEQIEQHREEGYMLTSVGQSFFSSGSYVGVWVESVGSENTKVTIVTKRKMKTNISAGLSESEFHKSFAKGVELVKAGQDLPIDKP